MYLKSIDTKIMITPVRIRISQRFHLNRCVRKVTTRKAAFNTIAMLKTGIHKDAEPPMPRATSAISKKDNPVYKKRSLFVCLFKREMIICPVSRMQ